MAWSPSSRAPSPFVLDVRSLACFRIALGAVVVADALLRTRDIPLMLAPDGMFPLAALRAFFGDRWTWSLAFLVDATWWGTALLACEALAGATLMAGFGTRVATVAAWVAVVSIVRRTAPATNAGDEWLCCLLFWGMFLPLGAAWSVDALRRGGLRSFPSVRSPATAALVLQIAAVYLGAGISKWNPAWLSGEAVSTALSLFDHGTSWGDALARQETACRFLTWSVLALELVGPCLLVGTGRPSVRLALVALFGSFHVATAALMSLGLFASVGLAAWLAVVPSAVWDRWTRRECPAAARSMPQTAVSQPSTPPWERGVVAAALGIAALSFLHDNTTWRSQPAPPWLRAAVRATCLDQSWGMFGDVPRQRQWVYGRGMLADGREIDVLRAGRPLEDTLPAGGFTSLPHHRWHKVFWELPNPDRRVFAPSIAAALAREWNRRHDASQRITTLEIRAVRLGAFPAAETRHELLLAAWPSRDGSGTGNLDRWLHEHAAP
ncbi:MAG: HTTM domain-containing protein [Planctomycetia bacterium]